MAATRTKRSDGRRREIVSAAAGLFDRAGYSSATMDDIAGEVGIAKPTLYHYFGSKDEILLGIHEEFIDLIFERHRERAGTDMGPEQLIRESMVDILELMETHGGHVRVFFEHYRELSPRARQVIREKRQRYNLMIEDLFQRCIDSGVFRKVDVRLATLAMFGMCNWAYQWYRPKGSQRPRDIAESFWTYLVQGLEQPQTVRAARAPASAAR